MSLILEGFMGCGKSAVGRELALRLGTGFIDTDTEIERKQGQSIRHIFDTAGEEAFRQMETAELYGLMLDDTDAVISLGGGTPMRAANLPVIKRLGRTIYLKAPADVLNERLKSGTYGRPMLSGYDLEQRVTELLRSREGRYLDIADAVVEIRDEDVGSVCEKVMKAYEGLK